LTKVAGTGASPTVPVRSVGSTLLRRLRTGAPLVGLGAVVALDGIGDTLSTGTLGRGLLDEPAHLLTAVVLLSAVPPAKGRVWWWALAGSVAIDLDHLPLYTFARQFSVAGGRPPTHSLATVIVLLAVAAAVRRMRRPLVGLAAGVGLHLVRDVVTGPGIPLLWPLSESTLRLPYPLYLLVLGIAAVVGVSRRWRPARQP
jgi:inner membrane protein